MELDKVKIGVIGAGNMGGALIAGLITAGRISAAQITAVDSSPGVRETLNLSGVRTCTDPTFAIDCQDVIVLAVKPQNASGVLQAIGTRLDKWQVLLSLMAGVRTEAIEALLPAPVPVIRAMPQILAQVRASASAVCCGQHASPQHLSLSCAILDEVGATVVVDESQMDAVTGLSGSGPAYVCTIIEALTDGGVCVGLPRDVALKLAAQTVLGTARMVLEHGVHPALLKERVTSPGGTTIAGLHKLEEKGLRDALISAVKTASRRARELGKHDRHH